MGMIAALFGKTMFMEIVVEAANKAACEYVNDNLFTLDEGDKVIEWDSANGTLEIKWEMLTAECATYVASRLVTEEYKAAIAERIRSALEDGVQLPKDHVSVAECFMKKDLAMVEKWGGILETALEVVHDSWDLGIALRELGTATSTLVDQANNKGLFDTYGLRLISSLKLRMDALNAGGLVNYDWSAVDIQNFSVEQLDSYRQALVTLTNYDTNILLNYRNMRVINDNNGNKFDYDLEWLSTTSIDLRRNDVNWYRNIFMTLPDVYESLFD